ncbi:hypothetical protein DENSPDRAFT_832552 [Dentipellis sp. KUC8613]|nr:hypothetical protein DENSPDRAFT_832552 [Dentipellis sp. KUC8613]
MRAPQLLSPPHLSRPHLILSAPALLTLPGPSWVRAYAPSSCPHAACAPACLTYAFAPHRASSRPSHPRLACPAHVVESSLHHHALFT